MENVKNKRQIISSLSRLRSEAGMTQAILAKKIGCDQAKLSNIESGKLNYTKDIDKYLEGIGTKNSLDFKKYLQQTWRHIEMPSFWNPQISYLEEADRVLEKASIFLNGLDSTSPVRNSTESNIKLLKNAAKYLSRNDHKIVFIGNVGVGKSTAISYIFNLLLNSNEKSINNNTILETSGGRTTICEVRIKNSEHYRISIIPSDVTKIKQVVSDYCTTLWIKNKESKVSNYEDVSISAETTVAIRNMANIARRKNETDKNKTSIENILNECVSKDDFIAKVFSRINVDSRTETEISFKNELNIDPKKWLQDTFVKINRGLIPTMMIPEKITISYPKFNDALANNNPFYDVVAVDTKGLDDIVFREDIDTQIKDERSILVFCSKFNDAPSTNVDTLLKHMIEMGIQHDSGKASILVLPTSTEARSMKWDDGEQVEDVTEGYDLKREQILKSSLYHNINISFFDAMNDTTNVVLQSINEQIEKYRTSVAHNILDIIATIEDAIDNSSEQKYKEAVDEAVRRMLSFFEENKTLPKKEREASLDVLGYCENAHASTLWASTRRNGNYSGLNFYHLIKTSIRKDVNSRFNKWINKFEGFQSSLKLDNTLQLAHVFISGFTSDILNLRSEFLQEIEDYGYERYSSKLYSDFVWQNCSGEWGKGTGFKVRVLNHLRKWFQDNAALQREIDSRVEALWNKKVLNNLIKKTQKRK